MQTLGITSFWNGVRRLPNDLKVIFDPQRIINELVSLRPFTLILLVLMTITNMIVFIFAKDFSWLGWVGLATTISTVINLILVDQGRITNYFWGLISVTVWLIIAAVNHLIGDIAAQLFYWIMQFVGLSVWNAEINHQSDNQELTARKMTFVQGVCWAIVCIVSYLIVLHFSKALNGTQIYLDAALLPLGIVGQILMTYGYSSQWVAWIILNVISLVIWFNQFQALSPASTTMLALQIMKLINSIYGYWLWRHNE
ncbi:nicotinamide riboside transporter PnuC [Lactobacillus sp. Sy-1]|uniref:nicotinamide riboside transporter PnuC n=1 Tax=Lactobacillus sp. Sy-1 TaxID=2109645 RepID=UPI001C59AE78|nr:nicotinamide riboside transporter PnuC [Lactobacillus sp. Sy-1]MBW1605021.1 nicotinamide mononucleotide transporter [Lactobacillus sp. Sy-1]